MVVGGLKDKMGVICRVLDRQGCGGCHGKTGGTDQQSGRLE